MLKSKITTRGVVQTIFLAIWIFLFIQIGRQASTFVPPDLFLMTDPLATILAMSAARVWVPAVLSSLVLIVLTFILGRFFCGWICPLGTVLDVVGLVWPNQHITSRSREKGLRRIKYYVLVGLCIAAVLGSQAVFFFDPLVLSFRAVALGIDPSTAVQSSFLSLFILLAIVGLCGITKRFWCRYLCALGALYGTLARYSFFRRKKVGCDACKELDGKTCLENCVQGVGDLKQNSPEECIRCLKCENVCEKDSVSFAFVKPIPGRHENIVQLNRRSFVTSLGIGAAAGYSILHARSVHADSWRIVRPPMVTDTEMFLNLCVRCGQCIKSCPTATLQPLFLEAGLAGLWTPAITPSVAGCKDDCNACSEVCPTHAIPVFGPGRREKWQIKMGQVSFHPDLCISYAPDAIKPCLKCVEVCPNKAIYVDNDAKPPRPHKVEYALCVGCGLCETACRKMVVGRPSMELTSNGVGLAAMHAADPRPELPLEMISDSKKNEVDQ